MIAVDGVRLDPRPFELSWGDIGGACAAPFRRLAALALGVCIVDSIEAGSRVTLSGYKRLPLDAVRDGDAAPDAECLGVLVNAVRWAYEERPETRIRLLAERLTLELSEKGSLVGGICTCIGAALEQSRSQYRFVISERRDAYARELRDLQRDIRTQADMFAEKTRSILASLLRDSLAAVLVLSIGLFARMTGRPGALGSGEADLLFKVLGAYVGISLALQAMIHARDAFLTNEELNHWLEVGRAHMPKSEVQRHLDQTIERRRKAFYCYGVLVAVLYVVVAVGLWNLQAGLAYLGLGFLLH